AIKVGAIGILDRPDSESRRGYGRCPGELAAHGHTLRIRFCDPVSLLQEIMAEAPAGKKPKLEPRAGSRKSFPAAQGGINGFPRIAFRPNTSEISSRRQSFQMIPA